MVRTMTWSNVLIVVLIWIGVIFIWIISQADRWHMTQVGRHIQNAIYRLEGKDVPKVEPAPEPWYVKFDKALNRSLRRFARR